MHNMSDFSYFNSEIHYENRDGFISYGEGATDIYVNVHDDFEIIYMHKGYAKIHLDDRQVELEAGCALFVNPRCIHFGFVSDDARYYVFLVKNQLYLQNVDKEDNIFFRIISGELEFLSQAVNEIEFPEIVENLKRLIDIFQQKTSGWKIRVAAEFFGLAAECLEKGILYKSKTSKEHGIRNSDKLLYIEFFKYVSMHYSEKISVQMIATELGVSESKLYKTVKIIQGCSPVECILKYRLQRATQLLRSDTCSVTELGYECGFGNISYFISQFKKHYGISPHQYKKKNTE